MTKDLVNLYDLRCHIEHQSVKMTTTLDTEMMLRIIHPFWEVTKL